MNYEAAKAFADQVQKELEENPDAFDPATYRAKCNLIVEMRHPKMDVFKQSRLVAKMMDERFPVKKGGA